MTRKRFKKLSPARGVPRNEADAIACIVKYVNQHPEAIKSAKEETLK